MEAQLHVHRIAGTTAHGNAMAHSKSTAYGHGIAYSQDTIMGMRIACGGPPPSCICLQRTHVCASVHVERMQVHQLIWIASTLMKRTYEQLPS